MTARNKPKTREQKFAAWWLKYTAGGLWPMNERGRAKDAWLAGYLAGYRARQYEGDQRGRVQRADHPTRGRAHA